MTRGHHQGGAGGGRSGGSDCQLGPEPSSKVACCCCECSQDDRSGCVKFPRRAAPPDAPLLCLFDANCSATWLLCALCHRCVWGANGPVWVSVSLGSIAGLFPDLLSTITTSLSQPIVMHGGFNPVSVRGLRREPLEDEQDREP